MPKVDPKYTLQHLKADLWTFVVEKLKQGEAAKDTIAEDMNMEQEEPTIVDIHFALGDYGHIESIKAMILATRRINNIRMELGQLEDEQTELRIRVEEGKGKEDKKLLEEL